MAEIVNLRRARKAKARAEADAQAAENRAHHGVAKAIRDLTKARTEKAANGLDGHRLQDDKSLKD